MELTVKAELISVGTELLRGEITDTNATYLATQLPPLGIELHRMTTAADDITDLSQLLRQALENSDIIITTGGLGPTQDDLTREAIAEILGESLTVDPELEGNLRALFSRFGREMPPHNIKQAMLIPSAQSLPNPRGTATGWWVEKNKRVIISLPGPPREMTFMWQNEVIPRIKKHFSAKPILTRTIKTYFIQEARVAELANSFFNSVNPILGIYAKSDGIHVRFIATGDDATQLLDEAEKTLTVKLAPFIWGRNEDTLDGIIGQSLIKHNLTLATIEDYSGGILSYNLTNSPLSVKYYHAGIIVPNRHAKLSWGVEEEVLNKNPRASEQMAEALAMTVREKFASGIGLSITGIDDSGIVFIGISDQSGTKTWQQQYQPNRPDNRERAGIAALFRLRERLLELDSI